ncbi:Arylsulfatase [Posidoniimonas polymericola]|uniref:Arylsulfatase n=1 Tax=Posidoniimonas polymericola TaxID=2528002 RepID=A0A5C5ZF55_9BACT|nr:sulfatase-like hydrolase/transferase [Posidoniimonas polymericola]TWT85962.1 Arylsulfatase [Posidoniimonas polymericola]
MCQVLCLIALLVLSAGLKVSAAERPNIILLMGDDHGWDETHYNGHPHLQTPALDAMAAHGLRLDHFYSAHPSCSPTRGSVLTGRHPNRYGVFAPGWSIRSQEVTIAHLLIRAGYDCAHFGKWHLGPVKASSPTNPGKMGFDHWLSHDNFFELNPELSRDGGPPEPYRGDGSEVLIDEAISYLSAEGRTSRPFCLVIWYGSPHEPYSGLPADLALYDDVPAQYNDRTVRVTSNETGEQVKRPIGDVLRERYAEITAMDRSIGRLRGWLKENDLRDNTLVWYCGDNGSWQDGIVTASLRGYKGTVYQGGVLVPGVIEWPARVTQPAVCEANAVTSDVLPTLCDLLDLPLPDRPLDGQSIAAAFDGEMTGRDNPICFWNFSTGGGKLSGLEPYYTAEVQAGTTPLVKKLGGRFTRNFRSLRIPQTDKRFFEGARAILDQPYKLVVHGGLGGADVQLFNLDNDPAEQHNLADEQPNRAAELKQRLLDWQTSVLASLTEADY